MKKAILILSLALFVLLFFPLSGLAQPLKMDSGGFNTFTRKARAANKCSMVYFTRPGCSPCQKMKKTSFSNENLKRIVSQKIMALEIDGETFEGIALAQKYKVNAYPTIIFFDPKGKIIGKLFGYQTAEKLIFLIDKHM